MVGFVIQIVIVILIVLYILIWLIASHIKSAHTTSIRAQLEKEYQEKYNRLENEYAEKMAALEKREQKVAFHEDRWNNIDRIAQWASFRHRNADERERNLAHWERDLEQRKQLLHRDIDAIIDYRVENQLAKDIKGKQKGIDKNWEYIRREKNTLAANNEKYAERVAELNKHEKETLARAKLIADHLGISLYCILNPKERKLVGELANELPEERYALMDLVMSCPDDQAKDLLKWMQRFPQSSQR